MPHEAKYDDRSGGSSSHSGDKTARILNKALEHMETIIEEPDSFQADRLPGGNGDEKMTVYELIQKLTEYKPRTEVIFHVNAEFDADGETKFDEDVYFDVIEDNEWPSHGSPNIVIKLGN